MALFTLRTIIFWSLMAVFLISAIYPWQSSQSFRRPSLHLPLLAVPLIAFYEALVPPSLAYRPDLLAIISFGSPVFGIYCFRLCLLTRSSESGTDQPRRLSDVSRAERRSLLPFNHESEEDQVAKLHR